MAKTTKPRLRLWNKLRYRKDDPRRYLHVPVGERKTKDTGHYSDAADFEGDVAEGDFNRDEVRESGKVALEEDLQ